jgi:hypothetical protein
MGWLFVALSVLGFLWALVHLRMTLIYLGVIPIPPGAHWGGVSVSLVLASYRAVATIRTIAWSIVLLVVKWPVLVTWVVLVWAIALLLAFILLLILRDFDKDPQEDPRFAAELRRIRIEDPRLAAELIRTRRPAVVWRLFGAFMGAVAFVVCVYKLGI